MDQPIQALARSAGATLSEQLAQRLADRIAQRLLPPGARLPSVRAGAKAHRVSASTVVGAYDLLQALAWCLEQGLLRRHAERVVQRLDAARARTERLVHDAGFRFVTPPQGLFGWIDVGADTERLAQALLDDGWLTAPGTLFHATRRPTTLMRVNFATSQDARFWQRLRALAGRA